MSKKTRIPALSMEWSLYEPLIYKRDIVQVTFTRGGHGYPLIASIESLITDKCLNNGYGIELTDDDFFEIPTSEELEELEYKKELYAPYSLRRSLGI